MDNFFLLSFLKKLAVTIACLRPSNFLVAANTVNIGSLRSRLSSEKQKKTSQRRNPSSMQKAFGIMHIKSIDEDLREIIGIATSATPDKHNDIVEPEGAVFNLPIPLLWQHDKHQTIGEVVEAELCD